MESPTIEVFSSADKDTECEERCTKEVDRETAPKSEQNVEADCTRKVLELTDCRAIEPTKTMDSLEVEMATDGVEMEQAVTPQEVEVAGKVVEVENIQIAPEEHSTDVEMANTTSNDHPIVKQEPAATTEELAEDFTRRTNAFPTEPTIKLEKNTSLCEEIAKEQRAESRAVLQIANSSLSLLAQYISSDSESNITDSDEELSRKNLNPVRHESTSGSSDDSIAEIPHTSNYRSQQKAIVISDTETAPNESEEDTEDDSVDEEANPTPPIKSRGEVLAEDLPPIEDLQITVSEEQCKPIGHVQSIVAQIVIVQSYAGVELLNLDTVLFLDKGKRTLGKIFDVIGQVAAPMYCVLFNSRQDVINKGITVNLPVYCAPQTEHTSFIILSDLMRHKGSDASWLDDIEAPQYALEYSDDEQERRSRRRGSFSSSGRQTPEGNRHPYPYRRGRGRGNYRGQRNGHSWHHNIPPTANPSQRLINPYALAAASSQAPPPPPSQ